MQHAARSGTAKRPSHAVTCRHDMPQNPDPFHMQIKRDDGQMASARMTRVAQPYVSPIVTRTVSRDGVPVGLIRVKAFNARTRADIADAVAAFQVRSRFQVCLITDPSCQIRCRLAHVHSAELGE